MRADAARQLATGYSVVAQAAKNDNDPPAEKAALLQVIDWYQKANRLAPSSRIGPLIDIAQARIREIDGQ